MKKSRLHFTFFSFILLVFLCLFVFFGNVSSVSAKSRSLPYKVMIGAEKSKILSQKKIETLVIDASFFSRKEIKKIHKNGVKKVYSYLNIGALENFRKDYDAYKDLQLGPYENWEEEIWVDVSDKRWKKRIVKMAEALRKKGVDGFFLDNADVYYFYESEKIYWGLTDLLKKLHSRGLPLIINGGDHFVQKAFDDPDFKGLLYAVNQETVFSRIDFETSTYHENDNETVSYYKKYVEKCHEKGLAVFLLEYGASRKLQKKIKRYCESRGFRYYIADSKELNN